MKFFRFIERPGECNKFSAICWFCTVSLRLTNSVQRLQGAVFGSFHKVGC